MHSAAWQKKHNAVQDYLVKAILDRLGTVHVNRQVFHTNSIVRSDIVIVNGTEAKITIVDVTIPFENVPQDLETSNEKNTLV
ncbi:hypothetical protein JTB14_020582 [Gonioctena quinquepunctata]|nr:hypothetical protein JTB14_020582 [Gonioctena quinquepunctata]